MAIDPTLTVAEVLERWPGTAAVFVGRCMACVGCAMARFDTIADAAAAYGVAPGALVRELRRSSAAGRGSRAER